MKSIQISKARGFKKGFEPLLSIEKFVTSLVTLSPHTQHNYRAQLKSLQRVVAMPIEAAELEELLEGLRRYRLTHGASSMISMLAALKKFLTYYGRADVATSLPRAPNADNWLPPEPLTESELDKVLATATFKEKVLILTFYSSAARAREIFADPMLQKPPVLIGDVNFDEGKIRIVGKGNRPDYLIFWARRDETLAALREYVTGCDPEEPLFPYSYDMAKHMISNAGRRAGIKLHLHLLRHTAAYSLLHQRVDIRHINAHLRHSKLDTTLRYTRVCKDDLIALAKERPWR